MRDLRTYHEEEIRFVLDENDGLFLLNFCFPLVHIAESLRCDLRELAPRFAGAIEIAEVLLPYDSPLVSEYRLRSIPTMVLFNSGDEIERLEKFWVREVLRDYLDLAHAYYGMS